MDDKKKEQIKSVIYARVSPTKHLITANDLHQSVEEALIMCRRDAEKEGNTIVKEYIDEYVSGKATKFMVQFNEMMEDAKNGVFERIYCRRVNRFGRNRNEMIMAEIKLSEVGVSIKFVENGIDTAKPFGKSILALLAELAQQDREEILENTKRGRERAKIHGTRSGKPFGHPKKDFDVNSIRALRKLPAKERPTWERLEKDYDVSRTVMLKRLLDAGFWDKDNRRII